MWCLLLRGGWWFGARSLHGFFLGLAVRVSTTTTHSLPTSYSSLLHMHARDANQGCSCAYRQHQSISQPSLPHHTSPTDGQSGWAGCMLNIQYRRPLLQASKQVTDGRMGWACGQRSVASCLTFFLLFGCSSDGTTTLVQTVRSTYY